MKILRSELKNIIKQVINEDKQKVYISVEDKPMSLVESTAVIVKVRFKNICVVDSRFIKSNGGWWNSTAQKMCRRFKLSQDGNFEIGYNTSASKEKKVVTIPSGEMWVGDCSWYWEDGKTSNWNNFLDKTNYLKKLNSMGQLYLKIPNGTYTFNLSWKYL